MGFLIDASILIDHERGRLDLDRHIAGREDDRFMISAITISELLHGVHRADNPVRRANRSAFVEALIDRMPALNIDLPTARSHAGLWAELADRGRMIGAHDLWIAAAAVAHDLTLVTANVREFSHVPGLRFEHWTREG